ncbi:translation initiation factor IF-2 [Variovorax sp. ZT4R33]|uniref:translation initiation factor IF-2 n=1 Tax=Variovorax sp. ZT4R33 TaxID=3443743 RepID=UPI003F478620
MPNAIFTQGTGHSARRSAAAVAVLIAATLGYAASVVAQPAGNPKGTARPPVDGNSTKKPATRGGMAETASPDTLGPEHGPAHARPRNSQPPGGGTAGGLTRRNMPDTDPASKQRTDKGSAAPRPVPPSSR